MPLNRPPDFLEMSEDERMGLGMCRACRSISQYEEKCKIDPARLPGFMGAANVKREFDPDADQEDNGQGGHYGEDGPWAGEGIGEQDIRHVTEKTWICFGKCGRFSIEETRGVMTPTPESESESDFIIFQKFFILIPIPIPAKIDFHTVRISMIPIPIPSKNGIIKPLEETCKLTESGATTHENMKLSTTTGKKTKFSLRGFRQYMSVTYGQGGGGGDDDDDEDYEEEEEPHWNYKHARKFKKERIKKERKERKPRVKGEGGRGGGGGGKVDKTYSDVEGAPNLIECDICQGRKLSC